MHTSTTNEIAGYRITTNLGIASGISVRSRSSMFTWFANFQASLGGRVGTYQKLAEHARREAFNEMIRNAKANGAEAIVGFRYDANEITDGITEVIAYGTAVTIEPI